MVFSTKVYRLLEKVDPGVRSVLLAILEELERQREQWEHSVTKVEFNELKEIVRDLAEAQKRTEQRVSRLEKVVEELAEAQKRTEQRVEELAEAQKRTEQRVEELSRAQARTEQEIQKLTGELSMVKEELYLVKDKVEGLSNSVGFGLENMTYKTLPPLLERDFGIKVTTPLIRKYIFLPGGKKFQANIYGLGRRDGEEVIILGECKVRPSKKEVRRFLSYVKRLSEAEKKEVIALIVAHDFPPEIEEYLKGLGLKYYWSYELE